MQKDDIKWFIAILIAGLFVLPGCASLRGGICGGLWGPAGVEYGLHHGSIKSDDLRDSDHNAFALGVGSSLHTGFTVGLFFLNPIVGGTYLGLNTAFGAIKFHRSEKGLK